MRRASSFVVAVMFLAAPLASRADELVAQASQQQQQGQAPGAAQAPAAPATKPEAKPAGVTITPYGFILVNAFFNASNFTTQDYPGFAPGGGAPGTTAGNVLFNARQTRFGVRFTFPDAAGAKLAGVIEADFKGGYANQQQALGTTAGAAPTNIEWYRPVPRLRLAYGTATWTIRDSYKIQLLAGQEYGLVNPLFATSLAYVADPLFYFAGNLWNRATQVRLQGDSAGPVGITWQLALVNPLEQGNAAQNVPDLSSGNRSRMPNVEGRLAVNMVQNKAKVFEIGVAGHYGKQRFFNAPATTGGPQRKQDVNTLLAGVDVQVNTKLIGFKGEAFQGSNISEYFAHFTGTEASGQYTSGTGGTEQINPIRAQGIWGQLALNATDMIQLTFGGAVERDNKDDVAKVAVTQVYMNKQIAGGLILSPSKNWKAGVEIVKTLTTRTSAGTTAAARAEAAGIERQGYVTAVSTQFIF